MAHWQWRLSGTSFDFRRPTRPVSEDVVFQARLVVLSVAPAVELAVALSVGVALVYFPAIAHFRDYPRRTVE